MKVAILTQPLISNYGGIVQNWALQQTLIKMGHEPVTVDFMPHPPFLYFIQENLKSIVSNYLLRRKRLFLLWSRQRDVDVDAFVKQHIYTTQRCSRLSASLLKKYGIDAIVVGSDQVWRPRYNKGYLADMFLLFARKYSCIKLSYAASFGTDRWELTDKQQRDAKVGIHTFNGVSVRERSGVDLCKEHLSVEATHVLDPTLLLERGDYMKLVDKNLVPQVPYVLCYVIDPTEDITAKAKEKAAALSAELIVMSPDGCKGVSLNKWLSLFYFASFVITDSFHGSVFSVLFGKEFSRVDNLDRGGARFREIDAIVQSESYLKEQRERSLAFLEKFLSRNV
jgi:hypothetical protein